MHENARVYFAFKIWWSKTDISIQSSLLFSIFYIYSVNIKQYFIMARWRRFNKAGGKPRHTDHSKKPMYRVKSGKGGSLIICIRRAKHAEPNKPRLSVHHPLHCYTVTSAREGLKLSFRKVTAPIPQGYRLMNLDLLRQHTLPCMP